MVIEMNFFRISTRRLGFLIATVLLGTIFVAVESAAQTDIFIRGSGRLYPIATPQLCVERGQSPAATEIPEVMARNLDISGFFEVLNPGAYIETPGRCDARDGFAYSDWSVIGAEGLVRGVVQARGNEITLQLFLHDVQRQQVVLGKEYQGHISQAREMAHRFSNEIMKFFTGELGPFGSKIAYSSKVGRFKELFLMDMDGTNVTQLTDEKGLAVSPSWDAAGQRLVYTGYFGKVPNLFVLDVESRRREQITRGTSLEIGGKFSKDGRTFLAAQTRTRDSDIVLLDSQGNLARRITSTPGVIDVSPYWSPDYSRIVFTSNRAGGPQIYTMRADGSEVRRVSFVTSNYCTDPRWSPKGDRLAYVCRADGGFQIFSSRPDGSDALQLTSFGNNEDPSWSPDGRYIVFSTTLGRGRQYHLALMRDDGSNLRQLTTSRLGDSAPAWGPRPF